MTNSTQGSAVFSSSRPLMLIAYQLQSAESQPHMESGVSSPGLKMTAGQGCLAAPKPAPELHIPDSEAVVDVRVIDTDTLIHLNPKLFWKGNVEELNHLDLDVPIYCFLVSRGDQHVVFDLGVRKDWENYAPKVVKLIEATSKITPGTDVAAVLDNSSLGIRSKDISSVIWSHNHFDHIGDPSKFPLSTELVVGPGVRASSWPGFPGNPDAIVLDSDVDGRDVREIKFGGLNIGRFAAFDFFGDGSFYLLDAPGHAVGHLCALARTTAHPPSFVFMGADSCHHPGILRPTDYIPLPRCIKPSPFVSDTETMAACPGALLQQFTMDQSPSTPFLAVANSIVFLDHEAATDTIRKIQELDAADDIFVLLAHDLSIQDRIPLFPERINGWKAGNIAHETRWLFCRDFQIAVEAREDKRDRRQK